jgi:hypothetical protein
VVITVLILIAVIAKPQNLVKFKKKTNRKKKSF